MSSGDEHKVRWMARIDQLLNSLEQASSESQTQTTAREAVQLLLKVHKIGLAKLVQTIHQSGLTEEILHDELVNSLLLVHDLHPHNLQMRVENAVQQIRSFLQEHGNDAKVLGITNGVVKLRYHLGRTDSTTLTRALVNILRETILAAAPEIASVQIEESRETTTALSTVLMPLPMVARQ